MPDTLQFAGFTLDPATRRLRRGADECHLTPKAFDLLVTLASQAPGVATKADLHRQLWADTFVADVTLASLVKEIRRAFREAGEERPLLRTVYGVGYALDVERDSLPVATAGDGECWLVSGSRRLVLHAGANVVGRGATVDISLEHGSVSRRHAQITVQGQQVLVEDLGSRNGTRVAGQPLGASRTLADGDRIEFGAEVVVFRRAGGAGDTATEILVPR